VNREQEREEELVELSENQTRCNFFLFPGGLILGSADCHVTDCTLFQFSEVSPFL